MKYYGVMCCIFDGSLEDLEVDFYKPAHEDCGWFFFAKWFDTKEKRDKVKEYLRKTIKKIQEDRKGTPERKYKVGNRILTEYQYNQLKAAIK